MDTSSQQEIKERLGTQTDLTSDMIAKLQVELVESCSTLRSLKKKLEQTTSFCEASLQHDEVVRFYTGFPNLKILKSIFYFVTPFTTNHTTAKLYPCSRIYGHNGQVDTRYSPERFCIQDLTSHCQQYQGFIYCYGCTITAFSLMARA